MPTPMVVAPTMFLPQEFLRKSADFTPAQLPLLFLQKILLFASFFVAYILINKSRSITPLFDKFPSRVIIAKKF